MCQNQGRRLNFVLDAHLFSTQSTDSVLDIPSDRILPFQYGQRYIYQAIRQARLRETPATLLLIYPFDTDGKPLRLSFMRRFFRECRQTQEWAAIGECLKGELRDRGILTKDKSHFIVLLPEIDEECASPIICALKAVIREKLEMELKIGHASFPTDAITFIELLHIAKTGKGFSDAGRPLKK